MPDAIKAINQMMSSKSEKIQSRIYNVTSFNPSASDFFQLMIELYPTAKISYNINEVRQKIVDSWPSNIDDSLAKDEWGWAPDYNLKKTINEYLKS